MRARLMKHQIFGRADTQREVVAVMDLVAAAVDAVAVLNAGPITHQSLAQ